jgi:hypothetical protein
MICRIGGLLVRDPMWMGDEHGFVWESHLDFWWRWDIKLRYWKTDQWNRRKYTLLFYRVDEDGKFNPVPVKTIGFRRPR